MLFLNKYTRVNYEVNYTIFNQCSKNPLKIGNEIYYGNQLETLECH